LIYIFVCRYIKGWFGLLLFMMKLRRFYRLEILIFYNGWLLCDDRLLEDLRCRLLHDWRFLLLGSLALLHGYWQA
jgi:hypothetical protein